MTPLHPDKIINVTNVLARKKRPKRPPYRGTGPNLGPPGLVKNAATKTGRPGIVQNLALKLWLERRQAALGTGSHGGATAPSRTPKRRKTTKPGVRRAVGRNTSPGTPRKVGPLSTVGPRVVGRKPKRKVKPKPPVNSGQGVRKTY